MNDRKESINFLEEAEELFRYSFKLKDDLKRLLVISDESNVKNKFEELAFTGKYLYGLMNVLQSGPNISEVENLDHVKKDISANMELLTNHLRSVISTSDENTIHYFQNKYLQLNQQCMLHLKMLIEDLNIVKKYLNYRKRNL